VHQPPTHRNTLVTQNPLPQLGQRQVRLRLDQAEHVLRDRFGHLALDSIPRLRNTRLLPRRSLLPTQLAHIFPTDAKTLGQHTATALAALIGFQYPHPQIVRIGSSHPRYRGHFTREIQDYS
jgi:hypothetical protein